MPLEIGKGAWKEAGNMNMSSTTVVTSFLGEISQYQNVHSSNVRSYQFLFVSCFMWAKFYPLHSDFMIAEIISNFLVHDWVSLST